MRITFVLPVVDMGGGTRVVVIYARALKSMGHIVRLISTPPDTYPFSQKLRSWVTGKGWPGKPPAPRSHLDGSGLEHKVIDSARPITTDDVWDADIAIATWWETAEWVSRFKVEKGAKVYFIQGHEVFTHLPVARCCATYRLPLHKIVVSRWLKEIMHTQYQDPIVDLVPNSVDRNQFDAPIRHKQAVPTVGFVYSSSSLKGMDTLLAALRVLRERVPGLRIISFGSAAPTTAFPLPKDVEFFLSPSQDSLRDLYSQCDVWVSASRSEGFNLPALEAMACRTPVVATRTGWPEEAIENGWNGILVDVDNCSELARGVEWFLLRSDEEWMILSANAYQTAVAAGSWEGSAKKFEQALAHARGRSAQLQAVAGSV
jgi:glycosyltransferase involved in cell wall biosynthesis